MRLLLLSLLVCTAPCLADTIELKITFVRSPAKAGVVFALESPPSGKVATLDQKDKQFTSTLVVSDTAGSLVFKNSDSVDHNIYANDIDNGVQFDVGLMPPGARVPKNMPWKENSLVRVGCKIHPKMRSYIANFNTEDYLIIPLEKGKKDYQVTLDNVSPKAKSIGLLFAGYDFSEVEIPKGSTTDITLTRKGKVKANVAVSRN